MELADVRAALRIPAPPVAAVAKHDIGVLAAATAFGKNVVDYALAVRHAVCLRCGQLALPGRGIPAVILQRAQ